MSSAHKFYNKTAANAPPPPPAFVTSLSRSSQVDVVGLAMDIGAEVLVSWLSETRPKEVLSIITS